MRVSAPSTRCSARSAPHCRLLAHRSCRSSAPQTSPPPCSTAQVAFASSSSGTSSQPRLARRAVVLASLSSHPFAAMAGAATSTKDLLIVGPGVLGAYAGKLWSEHFKGSKVVGQTNTTNNHHRLERMGITPQVKEGVPADAKYPYVLFSAPPSGSQDYAAEVKAALSHWDGTGNFVFTSSLSVCSVDDGGSVTDDNCPTLPMGAGPSTDRLLAAEQAVLQAGGSVVRLVGLYHRTRGAHTYFAKLGEVPRYGGYVVNLIHYQDAAGLAVAVLRGDGAAGGAWRSKVFLGSDNHPTSFSDMMDVSSRYGVTSGKVTFTGDEATSSKGKRVSNEGTRRALGGWKPQYDSFAAFAQAGGDDFYSQSGLY